MDNEKREILITASDYILKLKTAVKNAAELFQAYDETKGSAVMIEIIDGLQWLTDALVITEAINNEEVVDLNKKLEEIVEAFENEDYVLIGDLLFYEMLPAIEDLESKIKNYI